MPAIVLVVLVLLLLGGAAAAPIVVDAVKGYTRDPNKLLPHVRDALAELRRRLDAEGIRTFVGQTLRSIEYQRTLVGKASDTLDSWHLLGRAVDLYPYNPDTGQPDLPGKRIDLFRRMHDVAKTLGFEGIAFNADGSLRRLKSGAVDLGHLQFRDGMTFAQAARAQRLEGFV